MKRLVLLPSILLFAFCLRASTPRSLGAMPQIINVSAYDPKEKQRSGVSYSERDVSALRANGASGLIARAGKGGNLDEKCATFLASADRAGMLPGVYYRLQTHVDAGGAGGSIHLAGEGAGPQPLVECALAAAVRAISMRSRACPTSCASWTASKAAPASCPSRIWKTART